MQATDRGVQSDLPLLSAVKGYDHECLQGRVVLNDRGAVPECDTGPAVHVDFTNGSVRSHVIHHGEGNMHLHLVGRFICVFRLFTIDIDVDIF